MKIIKAEHIVNQKSENHTRRSGSDKQFVDMLSQFMKEREAINGSSATNSSKIELESYNGYSELKINHLKGDDKDSYMVKSILQADDQNRLDRIELVKKRLESGFYSRDDIILETAGKILDEVDVNL